MEVRCNLSLNTSALARNERRERGCGWQVDGGLRERKISLKHQAMPIYCTVNTGSAYCAHSARQVAVIILHVLFL